MGCQCISFVLFNNYHNSDVLFMYIFQMVYSFLIEHYDGLLTFTGERIFRIGCERYKMDSSGKTLQRISGGLLLFWLILFFSFHPCIFFLLMFSRMMLICHFGLIKCYCENVSSFKLSYCVLYLQYYFENALILFVIVEAMSRTLFWLTELKSSHSYFCGNSCTFLSSYVLWLCQMILFSNVGWITWS